MYKILFLFLNLILINSILSKPLVVICLDNMPAADLNKCKFMSSIQQDGLSSPGLEPVFPVKSFPNLISISTGLYPQNHGIIANNFQDFHNSDFFSIDDTSSLKHSAWYKGNLIWEWARQNGKIAAAYNWPATSLDSYKRSADISVSGPDSLASDFAVSMLSGETFSKADLVLIYMSDNNIFNYSIDSEKYDNIINNYDNRVSGIFNSLDTTGVTNYNYIILSTGGIKSLEKGNLISIESELNASKNISLQNYGSFMILDGEENQILNIAAKLGQRNGIYTHLKPDYPEELHFNTSPLTGKAIVLAEPGNLIINESMKQSSLPIKNANGYHPSELSMHGIFIGGGPDLKSIKTGTIKTIDIYSIICELLEIPLPNNLDSNPERINFILK